MKNFSHMDKSGRAKMVDVTDKKPTQRVAVATGVVRMERETLDRILSGGVEKGDVFSVAKIAGIQAAKRTSELIPLCHPLNITGADVKFTADPKASSLHIEATVKTTGVTGVEMEALCAVSAAALTVYDMCKAVDRGMIISDVMLVEKKGGRSGHYKRKK